MDIDNRPVAAAATSKPIYVNNINKWKKKHFNPIRNAFNFSKVIF